MKAIVCLAVLAVATVASGRQVAPKNVITDIIEGIINANRGKLANLNIPVIDLGEFGTVTDLTIQNLENFVLEKLTSPGPLSVDINNATISLTTASATGVLDLTNVEVPEIGLTLNGAGDLSGSADGLFLTVAIDIDLKGTTISVKDFTGLYINVQKINAALTGIDNADESNAIINAKLADFLNANIVPIAEANKPAILELINGILSGLGRY